MKQTTGIRRVVKLAGPIAAVVSAFLNFGCVANRVLPSLESPGRIQAVGAPQTIERTERDIKDALIDAGQTPEKRLLRVGHMFGAYREYGMIIDEKGAHAHAGLFGDKQAELALPLMKRAFESYALDAMELDVRAVPAGLKHLPAGDVVVVHNQPKWAEADNSAIARDYILKNSLRQVIDTFVASGEWRRGSKLYVELKAPSVFERMRGQSPPESIRVGEAVARVVADVPANARRSIAFISFSPQMLEGVHDSIRRVRGADVHDYVLILGPSSPWYAMLACIGKGKVPQFDEPLKRWLGCTKWVTCVWASPSPRVSKSLGSDMAAINLERGARSMPYLRVGLSTYQSSPKSFAQHFRQAWSVPKGTVLPACGPNGCPAPAIVESLIYDVDSENR